jgi:large subunit ribosomal protein L18
MLSKKLKYIKKKNRIRFNLAKCNVSRLRLSFYTSNKYLYTQIIDAEKGNTVISLATYDKLFDNFKNKNNIIAAKLLGQKFAKILINKNITNVYFDRGGLKYHGKSKAFADSARNNGLNF